MAKPRKKKQATTQFTLDPTKKHLLFVGCGTRTQAPHTAFLTDAWQLIRMDKKREHKPDVIGALDNLSHISSETIDTLWNDQQLPTFYPHQIPGILQSCRRVLKPNAQLVLTLPDIQFAAERLVKSKNTEQPLTHEQNPSAICTLHDLIWGNKAQTAQDPSLAYKTGFTAKTLAYALAQAGFGTIHIKRETWHLVASAYKTDIPEGKEPTVRIIQEDPNQMMTRRDNVKQEPKFWKGFSA